MASIDAIFIVPHVLQLREASVDYQMFATSVLRTLRVSPRRRCST